MSQQNRSIHLASRPHGAPTPENFRLQSAALPEPAEGQLLLRTLYLSLDPYMRGRMSEGPSYAPPMAVGDVMVGGTVSRVVQSRHPDYQPGDLVLGASGWQEYALSDGKGLLRLAPDMPNPSHALGVLGMPGFTAYMGLLDIGQPRPGETLVVAAATGPVGATVGQIAKLKGCRVVGIAGGRDKCLHAVQTLGFDACIDHRAEDFANQLARQCPKGIDIYFENVGGAVQAAVVPQLNDFARVPLCGLISQYNEMQMNPGPDWRLLLIKRATVTGFIVSDHFDKMEGFWKEVPAAVKAGKIKYREDVVKGIENAPQAFMGLLKGKNFGKLLVQVSEDSTRSR